LGLAACGGGGERAAVPDPCSRAPRPGDRSARLIAGTPPVRFHVPEGLRAHRRVPLVLGLHGAGQDADSFEAQSALSQVADDHGFVVAYPQSWRPRYFWRYPERDHPRSGLRLLRATIREAERALCVDPERVLVTGISSGGRMTYAAGCELADRVLAIAPVSGGTSRLPPCWPSRPVSLLDFHGTADPIVPYSTVPPVMAGWARRNRCAARPRERRPMRSVVRLEWRRCRGGARVAHYRIVNGGHAWPPAGGPVGVQLDGAEAIWAWFSRLPGR
jgi:polyhydroxybutyrate depolymerase